MKKFIRSTSPISLVLALVLSLGTLPLLLSVTGCETTSRQTPEERREDIDTTSRVISELSADTQYKYGGVTVSTFDGTVHLRGFVNSRDQKDRAASLARDLPGVREVKNDITVRESDE